MILLSLHLRIIKIIANLSSWMNLFFWWQEKLTTEIMEAKGLFCGIFSYENGKSIAGSFFFMCRFPRFYLQIL